MNTLSFFAPLPLLALAVGCSTPTVEQSLHDVQSTVAARTGKTIRPMRSPEDFKEARSTIESLLATNLTADAAVQIALLNNPELYASLEELGVARAELIEAGLLSNPSLGAALGFPIDFSSGTKQEYSLAGNFLELVMLPLRRSLARKNFEQERLKLTHHVLQLVAEVQKEFFEVQAGEQLLARLRLISEVNEAAVDVAQRQYAAGNINDLEFANEQAPFAQTKAAIAEAHAELRARREAVNRLLGLWGRNTHWTVAPQFPDIPKEEIPLQKLESLAMRQRLDVAAARQNAANVATAFNLRSRTRLLPLDLNVGVEAEREPEGEWLVGPSLDIELPIFNRGQADLARLGAQYRQAQRELQARAINARSEVREARDKLVAYRDLAEYYQKILLPLRIQIVNQTLLQYNAMQLGPFHLLAAKERELDAERDYIEAVKNYWTARAELERAVGGNLFAHDSTSLPKALQKSNPKPHDHQHHEHNH